MPAGEVQFGGEGWTRERPVRAEQDEEKPAVGGQGVRHGPDAEPPLGVRAGSAVHRRSLKQSLPSQKHHEPCRHSARVNADRPWHGASRRPRPAHGCATDDDGWMAQTLNLKNTVASAPKLASKAKTKTKAGAGLLWPCPYKVAGILSQKLSSTPSECGKPEEAHP